MKCENYTEWISLYIDHQLQEKDLKAFQAHLKQCTSCQEEVEILREIVKDIGTLERIALPSGFHEQLMEKIKKENQSQQEDTVLVFKKNKKWYQKWRVGSAIAAVFVFSVLILEIFNANAPKGAMPESANIQERSISMEEASPKMANDRVTEDSAIDTFDLADEDTVMDTFDLGKASPITWEIQTNEYEKCKQNILRASEEVEGEKLVITDTELADPSTPQFIMEITLEKSQKDLLLSKILETCKDDTIKLQENDKELEEGFLETIIIKIN